MTLPDRSFLSGLTLKKKILLVGVGLPALIISSMLVMYAREASQRAIDNSVDKARSICLAAESAREQTEHHWASGVFTSELLRQWGNAGEHQKVLSTVPVVTAWETARQHEAEGGYQFHVPALQPRNPANAPNEIQREALETLLRENREEYFVLNRANNSVHYFRPVRLTESCMNCHGDPANAEVLWGNSDGTDITGHPMENWQVGEMHGAFEVVQSLDQASAASARSVMFGVGVSILCLIIAGVLTLSTLKSVLSRVTYATRAITDSVFGLRDASRALQHDASDTSQKSYSMSSEVDQMACNVSSVSAAIEQIGHSISEIAEQSSRASRTADSAVSEAGKALDVIQRLRESSSRVDEVTRAINSLAEQTNLLALNATIEAARAGEYGRGFAVVANEVKELANQTSEATEGITAVIGDIRTDTLTAAESVERINKVICDINEGQHSVAVAVEEQRAMTDEIYRNIRLVSESGHELKGNINGVAESSSLTASRVDESAKLIQSIEHTTSRLPSMIGLS